VIRIERAAAAPSEWDALVSGDPGATLFQHPRWMNALLHAYPGYRPSVWTARDGGRAIGFLPAVTFRRFAFRQLVSLPFGSPGGPLVSGPEGGEAGRALLEAFRRAAEALDVMRWELTLYDPPPALREAVPVALRVPGQELRTHVLDLTPGAAGLWERVYHRGARRSVEGAERAGVTVMSGRDPESLADLSRLHRDQSREWVGIPPHSGEAIERMSAFFGDDARVYRAVRDGRTLAACLILEHEGKDAVPWVSGALPEAREVSAFHLLMHTAIAEAAGRGCRRWHFGGSGGNPRIEFFKESFGAAAVPVLRCHRLAGWARPLRPRPAWDA
jgi:CelD/BcsL family acetyltransferase involved in cellulose biosynthesis